MLLAVDFFIYKDKGLIKVLMINLRPSSLWTDLLILVSYLGFSYVLFRLQRDSAKEQKIVDEEATHAGPRHPVPKPNQYGHDERHASRHQQNEVESNIHHWVSVAACASSACPEDSIIIEFMESGSGIAPKPFLPLGSTLIIF